MSFYTILVTVVSAAIISIICPLQWDALTVFTSIIRKLQQSEGAELASKGQCATDCIKVEVTDEIDNTICSDMRVRCPCGSTLETDSMIRV